MLLELEQRGIVCSSGSACAAGSDEPSHALLAIGLDPDVARTSVRFTLGTETTRDEIDETIARVRDAVDPPQLARLTPPVDSWSVAEPTVGERRQRQEHQRDRERPERSRAGSP